MAYDVKRVSRDYGDLPALRKWAERHGKKLFVIMANQAARTGKLTQAANKAYRPR